MESRELRAGLWRWTAPHPDWRPEKGGPGGWERSVGCVYYEPPAGVADALVLIDPLAPPAETAEAERFWKALDNDVDRVGLPVAILLGNFYHERSAPEVRGRYRRRPGAVLWAHEAVRGHVSCEPERTFLAQDALPGGVQGHEVKGLEESETVFYLPPHRALVFADALIGIGEGRVRVAPASWAPGGSEAAARYRDQFRPSLRRLLELPIEMLLVSHGDPVLEKGDRALADALEAPAWGEE